MKSFLYLLIFLFYFPLMILSQENTNGEDEIYFINNSLIKSFTVKFYPVSMVFDGYNEYSLVAEYDRHDIHHPPVYNYINGIYVDSFGTTQTSWQLNGNGSQLGWNLDIGAVSAT